jgi:hypothetical protein
MVYVVRHGDAYKLGFTRQGLKRRVRDAEGELVLTIPVRQSASTLEYIINNRFSSKRIPNYNNKPGGKREWFALDDADVDWLRGLAEAIQSQ